MQASLLNDGTVEFRFRVASGGGAVYLVQRQTVSATGEEGQFENVGQADDLKRYFDTSVPTGVRSVSYRAQTRLTNGELSDWSETATIRFGTAEGTGSATSTGPATGESKAA